MNRIFSNVGPANPGSSAFDLSYEKKFTADMGLAYPVAADECLPGDVWSVGVEDVIRQMPGLTPVLHQIDCYVDFYFVPTGILMDNGRKEWEDFITGGRLGTDATTLPTWSPSAAAKRNKSTLWDFLHGFQGVTPDADSLPLDFGRRGYLAIFNRWYRDQNVETEVDFTAAPGTDSRDEDLFYVAWERDYFTASLPWQQRGTSPALPITISGDGGNVTAYNATDATARTIYNENAAGHLYTSTVPTGGDAIRWSDPGLSATSVDMNELRLNFAIQRFMERNARAGARLEEWSMAHFGVSPGDSRLDEPEFLARSRFPIVQSEVLGTNQDDTVNPQGVLAGHGLGVDRRRMFTFRVKEHGYMFGILSIRPKPAYHQGVDRQWMRRTRYEFYSPEFANISEQGVLQREIYIDGVKGNNETLFGYIPSWDEYRFKRNMVHGDMHDTFDHWHIARQFAAAPTLNSTFIRMSATDPRKDHLAVPGEAAYVVNHANIVRCVRKMPALSSPMLRG